MPHVAVIDDDPEVVQLLTGWLEQILPGVTVAPFLALAPALDAIANDAYDLVIADVDLGNGSGTDRFGGVRIAHALDTRQTPLLVVSGATDAEMQAEVFNALDAWDYLQKPVSRTDFEREVLRAVTFRKGMDARESAPSGVFAKVPELKITRRTGSPMEWKGRTIRMPMSKIDIVEVLARNAGEVVPHEKLIACIATGRNKENLRVKISEIRDKFEAEDPEFDRIQTVPYKGYVWSID